MSIVKLNKSKNMAKNKKKAVKLILPLLPELKGSILNRFILDYFLDFQSHIAVVDERQSERNEEKGYLGVVLNNVTRA